jgi:Phage tail sheath C-terminal domain
MAVTVVNGGVFPQDPGQRPGLYVRFIEQAIATIGTGSRSKVGTLKATFEGTAVASKIYRVVSVGEAAELFGADNIKDIQDIFKGGASEVVVGTLPDQYDTIGLTAVLEQIETYDFHVFVVAPGMTSVEAESIYAWHKTAKTNGKNFITVYSAGSGESPINDLVTDANVFVGEESVFVANGVRDAEGKAVSPEKYAQYIAGAIAGAAIDGSLTYMDVPYTETITRFRNPDIKQLLAAGCLVTVMDGDAPRIEQGLTLGEGKFNKIRTVKAKQAMVDDINRAVNDNYIGKITNNEDGQIAVVNAIKSYLETLAGANVVADDYVVELDKNNPSVGADLYINIAVRFLDSIEYVYLTITV